MLGLLVIIIISWLLLHFIEKENIDAIGIIPKRKPVVQFLVGFLFIILITLLTIYIESVVTSLHWKMNSKINYGLIFDSFLYHLKSALTEDLIFRGALLYILIKKIGSQKAILLSAIAFGIYHWFSYGMINGPIVPLIYIFITTGFTGYVWAFTFNKTKSIMMPLGFHVGFNFLMTFFYTSQPYGELLFTEISSVHLSEWNQFYFSLFKGLFPSIGTLLFVKFVLLFNLKCFDFLSLNQSKKE